MGDFIFGENNLIWINKRLKLFIGLMLPNGTVEYVPQGVFVLTEPQDNHTTEGKTATINAVDKAYFMTDNRGKFVNELTIAKGAKITDVIKIIANAVGETLYNFDNVTTTVPYELTYSGEDNRWKALQDLAALAQCTIFYDVNGYLRLKKIDLNMFDNEPVTWNYKYGDIQEKLYAGNTRSMNDSNLANHIRVIGGSSQTKTVIYDLKVDENDSKYGNLWKGNPYSIQQIGLFSYFHNSNQPDPVLSTIDDCKFRAKFELMKRLGYDEQVQISLAPNYLHDAEDVVWLQDTQNGLTGNKYLIKSINLPLAPALMTMEVTRMRKVISDWNFI
jgi:hypothetical protein